MIKPCSHHCFLVPRPDAALHAEVLPMNTYVCVNVTVKEYDSKTQELVKQASGSCTAEHLLGTDGTAKWDRDQLASAARIAIECTGSIKDVLR